MLKNILNLGGVKTLNRNEQKEINGGLVRNTECKVTCCDGTILGTSGCSNSSLLCGDSGGVSSCAC